MADFELYTPSIRYENVKTIYRSLNPFNLLGYDIRWTIVFDSWEKIFFPELDKPWIRQFTYKEENGVAGNHQRNFALDNIDGNGICFSLDDDTIIHQDFFGTLSRISDLYEEKSGFLFHDQLSDDTLIKAVPGGIKENKVGNQNFALRRRFIGNKRFNIHYCSDGQFIEELYNQYPDKFLFLDTILAYHNRILWRTDWEDLIIKL